MSAAASSAASASASASQTSEPRPPPRRWQPSLLDNYDAILFDCDGVLWQETHAVPGAPALMRRLQSSGKQLLFATNNSGKSREEYMKKFGELGFDFKDDIFTSSQATAHYVSSLPRDAFDPATQSVLTVGEAGIASELRARGITRIIEARLLFPGGRNLSKAELSAQEVDPTIGCVIVGIDAEFSYSKAAYALTALSRLRDPQGDRRSEANRQALFISTNQDSTLPTAGHTLPGAGSVVAMVASCAGRTPVNIGKPEARMLDLALEAFPRLERKRVLMVGDRLDTDVLFGINGQVDTLLVTRTGIHNLDDAKRMGIQPTFECDDVTQMLDAEQQ